MVYFQKIFISLKLLPLKLSTDETKVNYDFLNCRFLLWLVIRLGLTALFIYFNILVCPPDNWNVFSLIAMFMSTTGMSAMLLYPFIFAEAFVRLTPYSLRCKSELSTKQWVFLITNNVPFFVAIGLIALPQLLNCSANQFSVTAIIGAICILIGMSTVEFLIGATIICVWMNHMIDNCETVLDKKSPTLAEIKDVLCQYETLRVAVDRFVFLMFTAPQIVLILAVFIATAGTVQILYFLLLWKFYCFHFCRKPLLLCSPCGSVMSHLRHSFWYYLP